MKRIVTATAIVLGLATVACAQEIASNYEHLKGVEFLVGEWHVTGQWNMPDEPPRKFESSRTAKWVLGKNFIESESVVLNEDGTAEVRHKSMLGWDEDEGAIKAWGFWRRGINEEVEFIRKSDDRWVVEREGLRGVFEIINDDQIEYSAEFTLDDGREGSWSYTATRVQVPKPAVPENVIKELRYHVGSWAVEGKVGDESLSGISTVQWASGKHAITSEGSWTGPKGEKTKGTGVSGWDGVNKKINIQEFWSTGWSHRRSYTITAPGIWTAKSDGVNDEGQTITADVKQEVMGDDHFVWSSTNNVIGGEPAPDVEIHFRRVKQ